MKKKWIKITLGIILFISLFLSFILLENETEEATTEEPTVGTEVEHEHKFSAYTRVDEKQHLVKCTLCEEEYLEIHNFSEYNNFLMHYRCKCGAINGSPTVEV